MDIVDPEITCSDLGEVDRDKHEPQRRTNDVSVREFLVAGAQRGLTTDQMFTGHTASGTRVPEPGARSTP